MRWTERDDDCVEERWEELCAMTVGIVIGWDGGGATLIVDDASRECVLREDVDDGVLLSWCKEFV